MLRVNVNIHSTTYCNMAVLSVYSPLQSMVLDNYPYATNELVGALW